MHKCKCMQNSNNLDKSNIPDELNPSFIFSGIHSKLLSAILKNEADIIDIAKKEMENRGLDINGKWVGFGKEIKINPRFYKHDTGGGIKVIVIPSEYGTYISDENGVGFYTSENAFIEGENCISFIKHS